jgi:Ca2+-binding EF-hand superfamily protein
MHVRFLFEEIDKDKSGFINVSELYEYLIKKKIRASQDEVIHFLKTLDKDHDEKIDIHEFLKFILANDPMYTQEL